jgi:CCR4-NOT transcription complex subunit 3
MEKFKIVEKAMKTKAFSKEGLSAATKLDPKERAKLEACNFLGDMVDELGLQIETLEAEAEGIQATMKKGKMQSSKADRMAKIEHITERHKWHQGKLELIKRSLENGGVETDQVTGLEDDIRYYVSDGMTDDFMEDEQMYDDLNLEEEEDNYGMNNDNDRVSSQDTQSIQDEAPEAESRSNSIPTGKSKVTGVSEAPSAAARRPSTQLKSPLPALATLHTPLSGISNGTSTMKPASVPVRAAGEPLKYASAAAAAAASDKANMGIAPLPPPPEALPPPNTSISHPPLPSSTGRRPSLAAVSPAAAYSQPAAASKPTASATTTASELPSTAQAKSPALSQSSVAPSASSITQPAAIERAESTRPVASRGSSGKAPATTEPADSSKGMFLSVLCISVRLNTPSYHITTSNQWDHKRCCS